MNDNNPVCLPDFLTMAFDWLRQHGFLRNLLANEKRVKVLRTEVVKRHTMPIHFKLLEDRRRDCMIEARLIRMSKNDRYSHAVCVSPAPDVTLTSPATSAVRWMPWLEITIIVLQQVGALPLELAESLFPTVQRVPPVRTVRQIWS
jgi:hypothetical protein